MWGRFIPLWILKGPLWKVRYGEISSVWKESLVFHSLNKTKQKNVEISLKLPSVWKLIWPGMVSGRVGRWKDNSGKFFSARRNYQTKTQTFHHAVPFLLLCLSVWLTFFLSLIYTNTCFLSISRTHPEPERKVHSLICLSFSCTYSLDGHKNETPKCEPSSRSFIIACHFESDTVWLSHCANHFLTLYNKGNAKKLVNPFYMSNNVFIFIIVLETCGILNTGVLCMHMWCWDLFFQENLGNKAFDLIIGNSHIRGIKVKWK